MVFHGQLYYLFNFRYSFNPIQTAEKPIKTSKVEKLKKCDLIHNKHVTYSTLLNHIEGDLNSLYVCIC